MGERLNPIAVTIFLMFMDFLGICLFSTVPSNNSNVFFYLENP